MTASIQWTIFFVLSTISIVMSALMIVTMSMYRAGLALMTSLLALAGLFVLLDADLLAAMQVMMNVGGMIIMILFMVMIMMDPGGEMMWKMKRDMKMSGPGALSMRMPSGKEKSGSTQHQHSQQQHEAGAQKQQFGCPMHPEVRQDQPGECPKCGMKLAPLKTNADGAEDHRHEEHVGGDHAQNNVREKQHGGEMSGMDSHVDSDMMTEMAMSTVQMPWALAAGAVIAFVLSLFVAVTPWHISSRLPSQESSDAVGRLLLSRYMIAFEAAAFLILAGMVGAVVFATKPPTTVKDRRK